MTTKKKTWTAMLSLLQVREAIIMWARAHQLVGAYEDVSWEHVTLGENGSAKIKRPAVSAP